MASSSSSSPPPKGYQVFLSFRGEDTRRTFLSHLYGALIQYGIQTFKDDEELPKGGSISPELLQAIEQSQIALVVISRNYASSSWCLEELVKIIECKRTRDLKVIPVFYDIDPSDVKKLRGSFEEAFVKHKERFKEDKLREWEEVLGEVGSISGWDSRNWDNEHEFINKIVENVLDRLPPTSSSDTEHLVAMDIHSEKLECLLSAKSDDVRMIGLWGMGGIGKTTIARYFYDRLSKNFPFSYFMENVKEVFKNHGTSDLLQQFLSHILRDRNLKLWDAGNKVIQEKLCRKRVLVVLDDVDKKDQLDFFAGKCEWFGAGSKIIITTRDKKLLEDHGVQDVYEVTLLDESDALQLFSKCAFKQDSPEQDFYEFSIKVIKYAGGLPLALNVLGSMLRNRSSKSMWQDTLEKLSDTSIDRISEVLRVSYDRLDNNEKNIFLYIACLFKGMSQSKISSILKACGFRPDLGIGTLIERSLITCDDKLYIQVHDLLQDMARDIIRQDFLSEPWKHKIVWNPKDISKLFKMLHRCNDIIKVEAMLIDMSKLKGLQLSPMAFTRMHDLIFLKICSNYLAGEGNVQLPGGLDYLPEELAYLFWENFPLKSLPSRFHPENLVELHLHDSGSLERLWNGAQPLWNLRVMNLSGCSKLIEFPNLSKATRLERLCLSYCENLSEVSSSIGNLHNLYNLDLNCCRKLTKLPSGINLKSLDSLNLSMCNRLREFPCISENVRIMCLWDTAIEEVPPSVKHLSRLKLLYILRCKRLKNLPDEIENLDSLEKLVLSNCKRLKNLPDEIQNLGSLEELDLSNCSWITKFPEVGKNIKYLNLTATAIEEVPPSVKHLSRLKLLNMSSCKKLKNLPNEIQNLDSLEELVLSNCKRLKNLPDEIQNLGSLEELDLSLCFRITEFPKVGKNIKYLKLIATAIEEVPTSIKHLSKLEYLNLSNCKRLKNLPDEIQNLDSLEKLDLSNCKRLKNLPGVSFVKLQELVLSNCVRLKNLPDEIQNLGSLENLDLLNCPNITEFPKVGKNIKYLNLKATAIEEVPTSIKHHSQLEYLNLSNCKRLKNLPDEIQNLDSLEVLRLSDCPGITKFPKVGKNINYLKLKATAIEEVPPSIEDLSQLEYLDLSNCKYLDLSNCKSLKNLPDEILNLGSLEF